jgi:hypothetical protein
VTWRPSGGASRREREEDPGAQRDRGGGTVAFHERATTDRRKEKEIGVEMGRGSRENKHCGPNFSFAK